MSFHCRKYPSTTVLHLSLSFAVLVHTAPCCPTMSSLQRCFGLPTDHMPFIYHSVLLVFHIIFFHSSDCTDSKSKTAQTGSKQQDSSCRTCFFTRCSQAVELSSSISSQHHIHHFFQKGPEDLPFQTPLFAVVTSCVSLAVRTESPSVMITQLFPPPPSPLPP